MRSYYVMSDPLRRRYWRKLSHSVNTELFIAFAYQIMNLTRDPHDVPLDGASYDDTEIYRKIRRRFDLCLGWSIYNVLSYFRIPISTGSVTTHATPRGFTVRIVPWVHRIDVESFIEIEANTRSIS